MMLLLRLFLLVMLIRDSSSADVPSVPVEDCDKMKCFAFSECTHPEIESKNMVPVEPGVKVTPDCDAIAKIRSYSKSHYLIVLESPYIRRVKSIKLQQGTTEFECIKDGNNKVSASSVGDNNELSNIETKLNPLSCKFHVRSKNGDVFPTTSNDVVKLSSGISPEGNTMKGTTFHSYYDPTCDPDSVKPAALGAVGDKTVSAVDVQLADLVCPAGNKLMYRGDSTSDFKEASSITCKKAGEVYEFEPKLAEAQCAVTTCTQCNSTMAPALPNLETYDEGGCTKLRCKDNARIKIGSAAAVEGSAECKFENNEHVWQLKGITIKADTAIECQGKVKCFSTEEEVKQVCKDCALGPDNLPKCAGETSSLMYETVKMAIYCDDITGKFILNDGTQNYTELKPNLHCEDKKAMEEAAEAEKQKSSQASVQLALYIVLPLLALGILAGIVYAVWRLHKRKPEDNDKKAAEEGQKKSDTKSAKSVNSVESKKKPALTEEEKQVAEQRARIHDARRKLEEERRQMVEAAIANNLAPGAPTQSAGNADDDIAVCGLDLKGDSTPALTEAAPEPQPAREKEKERSKTECRSMANPAVPIVGGRHPKPKK